MQRRASVTAFEERRSTSPHNLEERGCFANGFWRIHPRSAVTNFSQNRRHRWENAVETLANTLHQFTIFVASWTRETSCIACHGCMDYHGSRMISGWSSFAQGSVATEGIFDWNWVVDWKTTLQLLLTFRVVPLVSENSKSLANQPQIPGRHIGTKKRHNLLQLVHTKERHSLACPTGC